MEDHSSQQRAGWPSDTSLQAFSQARPFDGEAFWQSVFDMHRDKMQIKNPKVALANLEKIFNATFKLANSKGFQAMSLRDLSRETDISMGGLYAYIGSKSDLAAVIEGVLRQHIEQIIGSLADEDLQPLARLRAIIFGEIYLIQLLKPWYYFCFMEIKGLDRAQQEKAMELELHFESILIDAFQAGVERGDFECHQPELLAAQVLAQIQQWFLKRWKFKLRGVDAERYAQSIYDNLLLVLGVSPTTAADSETALRPVAYGSDSQALSGYRPVKRA